jgi:pimeloyl-ACP methyl ester carboxylesterase
VSARTEDVIMIESETTSRDGTDIAYETRGTGDGVVVVPGNNRMAHDYRRLAELLADTSTVHVMERRGRGRSGPLGEHYRLEREVEDLRSVLRATGATRVFGHSYGGLIALQCARESSALERIAVYEPGVSIDGSFDASWLPRFRRELARGRQATAMAVFLRGTRLLPFSLPMPLMVPFAGIMLSGASGREMRDMMPTTPGEIAEIVRHDSDGTPYAEISVPVLLLGGSKSPASLTGVLPTLAEQIPDARIEIIPGLDHNAPDLNAPKVIASRLTAFLCP